MIYEGESLIWGQLGHFAIIASFVSALLAGIAYFMSLKSVTYKESYRRIGRSAFIFHGASVLIIFGLIIFLLLSKSYEYYYVWQHVSDDLSFKYVLSAFWEGQEGSFLLWMFWHVILGFMLIILEKKYEAPVLGTLSFIQLILASMLLGIYILDGSSVVKIGVNPFVLLRNEVDAPIFANADYLSMITGSGLNPLLQNYWMTIHPPVLFLGFGAVAVPFCYAIAGLTLRDHKPFLKHVLPWSLFAAGTLGTGILLGGLWAYEALSFGGYWAWDPVENMSLVPWIILLAGVHTNLIANATGQSIRSTYLFYILSFLLIVYSTFLTRSGVLGDTSVHAFTEMGLEWQLIIFIFGFTFWGLGLFFARYKSIPSVDKEENTWSREFWMFIGALTLAFSAVLISFTTSIPVFNQLFDVWGWIVGKDMTHLHRTSPLDPVAHYNKYQLWIAVFISLLSSVAILLRYSRPLSKKGILKFATVSGGSLLVGGIIHLLIYKLLNVHAWQYHLLLFTAIYTILVNSSYIIGYVKGNIKASASGLSHMGFGILILGVIASGLNKQFISTNKFAQRGLIEGQSEESLGKNITLLKGVPMDMSGYLVTYEKDTLVGIIREYVINFKRLGPDGSVQEDFNLTPNILYDREMTKVAASNPSTKHYLNKDIFTHIHALPPEEIDMELARAKEDSLLFESYSATLLDTFYTSNYFASIEEFGLYTRNPNYNQREDELVIGATIHFKKLNDEKVYTAYPFVVLRDGIVIEIPYQINELNAKVKLDGDLANLLFFPSSTSSFEEFEIKIGDSFRYRDIDFKVERVGSEGRHPFYDPNPDDLSVTMHLSAQSVQSAETYSAQPLYIIRGRQNFRIMDLIPEFNVLVEFYSIDPETENMKVRVFEKDINSVLIPMEIAENSDRTDWLVLEAIVFPGIILVWIGSGLMLGGLFLGIYGRRKLT